MMNLIRNFKENYMAIDETCHQSVNTLKSNNNENIEKNIFNALCEKISNPVLDKVNLNLGSVYFVNDQDEDTIMFKFSRFNQIFNTSQNIEDITKEINDASKIAFA